MEIMATSKNYGKKTGSDHFRDILNPYGEKPNYGKIGRRRRLSKLNVFFFSIILSVTIDRFPTSVYIYIYIANPGKIKRKSYYYASSASLVIRIFTVLFLIRANM